MRKVAIYPGSFNPWHEGHSDVLAKSLKIFDEVIVARGVNPAKPPSDELGATAKTQFSVGVTWVSFQGLLVDYINQRNSDTNQNPIVAIVKGLRNGTDLEYERAQQYYNEDLLVSVPTLYILTDRTLVHVSSSAIRHIKTLKGARTENP